MGYRDISHDSIAEANRQVIEESIARSQRDTHGWTFEETHHPHPQTPQPNPHLHKGNAENNYSTELNPEEQAAYKEYLKHHKMDHQKVNHSYDMTGFFKAYGMFDWNKVPTEEFTKPNHKHFTTDSIYSSSENPGGGWETDKTGHKVYVSSDKWYEKQISEMKPKHDIRIDESVTSAVEPKDTYHLDDPNSVHKYVNELRHQSRMAKASKAEHGHENLVQWADRHIAGLGTEIAAGVLGMLQMVPSFINTIGKWIEPTGEEMPDHDNVPKLLTDYIKLGKEKMQESAEKFRSDPHKEHPWLHQAEQLIDKSASFMTEMFLLGGATKGLEALAKAGEETGLAIKGATQSTIGDKVAQLIKNSVVPLGYFGGKSGTEYIDTHNDIIEYIKENGMPTDATPQEQAYYQAILSNEKDIQRNGYLIGLTEGGAFAAFHGLDVFEKLISPMVEKWGGNAMRKILSSAWIDAAEKGGLAGYAEKAAIAATTMGAETLIPGAASATTFGLITAVPAIVQHMVEERSFNKEWTWKEVGSEVLQSALQGVVMAVPAMVLGPKRGMAEVVYWNEEYLKNRGEAPVEDNIYNPSPLRMWESERTVNHMEENNMITKDDISQAINLSEKGPKGILTEIEKIAKTDPDRAHMIGAYATAVHNIEKIYKDPKFDKTLYKEFVDPLHKMLDTAGKPYDQTVKSETIYKQITESGNENLIQKAGEITDTILQREDLPNAIKDSVISYVLQHLSYAENGMQELGKVRDEQKDLYEKELGKMTEANARRAKDLHEGLMAVIKGEEEENSTTNRMQKLPKGFMIRSSQR